MRKTLLIAASALTLGFAGAPALADHHTNPALEAAMKSDARADDRARDQYRHPAETLAFFKVKPDMTVVEYGPGGGWYTRLLAPYVSQSGKYIALNADSSGGNYRDRASEGRAKSWVERFPGTVAEWTGIDAEQVTAVESDELIDEMKGTADRVLIFRSAHGMLNRGTAISELRAVREILKDDGMVGVVQHRAKADAPYSYANGSNGYLRESDVVALFELNGFELVESSDVNANANDPANWEGGVWTLPPTFRYGDEDRAKYEAIGETDRMTLLFRKRS